MNNITEWTYDKPTEEGLYLMCMGDVENKYSVSPFRLCDWADKKVYGDKNMGFPLHTKEEIKGVASCYKFARLLVGAEVEG